MLLRVKISYSKAEVRQEDDYITFFSVWSSRQIVTVLNQGSFTWTEVINFELSNWRSYVRLNDISKDFDILLIPSQESLRMQLHILTF